MIKKVLTKRENMITDDYYAHVEESQLEDNRTNTKRTKRVMTKAGQSRKY